MSNLSNSSIERQNVLNNRLAVEEIQKSLHFPGMLFDGEFRYTKKMVAEFYGVDVSTVDRYITQYSDELKHNGYVLLSGNALKEFKLQFGHLIDKVTKTTKLGLFNFRSFLNLGMLISDSEKAKQLRSVILDIVIGVINSRAGGGTKYINQRDVKYLQSATAEVNYRKAFTSAIGSCVLGHDTAKYAHATDMIYQAVFLENAREYRDILKLEPKDNVKKTLYAEVLLVIASFENGCAAEIRKKFRERGNKRLSMKDVHAIIGLLAEQPIMQPILADARTKMASRDLSFRDAYHGNLSEYLQALPPEEFERFIGVDSIDLDAILELNQDVLKRLKQDSHED